MPIATKTTAAFTQARCAGIRAKMCLTMFSRACSHRVFEDPRPVRETPVYGTTGRRRPQGVIRIVRQSLPQTAPRRMPDHAKIAPNSPTLRQKADMMRVHCDDCR
jgi:hypothetical protein